MLDTLAKFVSQKIDLQESCAQHGDIKYWHSTFLDERGHPISGGFGSSQNLSRTIACAEFIERQFVKSTLQKSPRSWGLDQVPTACGFAVGFEKSNTIRRSIHEAAERWVMSQWIDNKKKIPKVSFEKISYSLSPASSFFYHQFDEVWFYLKSIQIWFGGSLHLIDVAQTIAFKGDGVFPGSSAQANSGCIWEHALLESYRHLLAYKNNPTSVNSFPMNRVRFFAKNATTAIAQIKQAQDTAWPKPQLSFFPI